MEKKNKLKAIALVSLMFTFINTLIITLKSRIVAHNMDFTLLVLGNVVLFSLCVIAMALHIKAAQKENPNVLVRSIMGSMLIKMVVIGTGVVIYALNAKEKKSIPTVAIVMGLYVLYLIIEVKSSYKLNKKKPADASN